MRLLFVRHGDPDYSTDTLTPLGHRQAAAAAERLSGEGITHIVSSTCGRAYLTAQHTADRLGLPIESADFLREISWGSRNGIELPHHGNPWHAGSEAVSQQVPLMGDPEQYACFNNNRVLDSAAALGDGLDAWLELRGYRREGAYYRVTEDADEGTVAIFSHNGASVAAWARLFNLPFFFVCCCVSVHHTSITQVSMHKAPGQLITPGFSYVNDYKHTVGL